MPDIHDRRTHITLRDSFLSVSLSTKRYIGIWSRLHETVPEQRFASTLPASIITNVMDTAMPVGLCAVAELTRCTRDQLALKAENGYPLILYGKKRCQPLYLTALLLKLTVKRLLP